MSKDAKSPLSPDLSKLEGQNATPTLENPPSQPSGELKPFGEWAAAKNTPDWQLAAYKAHTKHPIGREVSEKEFDSSLKEALTLPLGGD
jgi:hypothetical protein